MLRKKYEPLSLLREIRRYIGVSQEAMARFFGVSLQTWIRWEENKFFPPVKVWEKIKKLLKKEAEKKFPEYFLLHISPLAGVSPYKEVEPGKIAKKTKEEILEEVEKNEEYVKFLKENVFAKKDQALANLPFKEAFKKYCKGEIEPKAMSLLISIPFRNTVIRIKKERRVKNAKNMSKKIIKKGKKREKRKNKKSKNKEGESEDSDEDNDFSFEILDKKISEFILLWKNEYNENITKEEATEKIRNITNLFLSLAKKELKNECDLCKKIDGIRR